MAGKHGPNKFGDYQSIHETVIARLKDEGFVLQENLAFRALGNGELFLGEATEDEDDAPTEGVIECDGELRLTVQKFISVLDGDGANAFVQTRKYSYTASISRVSGVFIFRYCSPHAEIGDDDDAEHHFDHHKHACDVLGTGKKTIERIVDEDARPTLGQVLEELREWLQEHRDELSAFRKANAKP